jgi:phage shock protein A
MALGKRLSRLLTADLHAVLDRLEQPEVLLRQAIREMEAEIGKSEQASRSLKLAIDQTRAAHGQAKRQIETVDSELDLCFANGDERLARATTARKLEARKLEAELDSRLLMLTDQLEAIETELGERRARLDDLARKEALVVRDIEQPSTRSLPIDETELELAFLREKQARSAT